MPRHLLLLDARVAINLAATDRVPALAEALDVTFVLVRQAAGEAGQLDKHTSGPAPRIVDLGAAEYPLYLELARSVDDGEAATIAVAARRNIRLATDDRKARRLCAGLGVREPERTIALIRSFADAAGLGDAQIRDLLIKIRDRASFLPPRADPDQKW